MKFTDVRSLVRRNALFGASVFGVAVAVAAIVTWMQPRIYRAEATIRIEEEGNLGGSLPAIGNLAGFGGTLGRLGSGIHTEIATLGSRQIADAVVDSLALQVRLLEPRVPRDVVLERIRVSPDAGPATYRLELQQDGTYTAHREAGSERLDLPSRVEVGGEEQFDELSLALHPGLSSHPPARIRFEVVPKRTASEQLRRSLKVAQPNPAAQMLSITYSSPDPVLAAAVPNAATASFVAYKTRTGRHDASEAVAFLQDQIRSYAAQLADAEARLQKFRERAQVVDVQTESAESVRRLAQLEAERDRLLTERESLRALLARAAQPVRPGESSPFRQLASYPVFFASGQVQSVLSSLIQLENERADLLVRRTPENPDVRALDERIREMQQELAHTARSYLAGREMELAAIERTIGRFGGQAGTIPARQREFVRLTREQQLLEEVYTLLQTRLKEAEIREASTPGDVRVLDAALVPERPSRPRPPLNLALGAMLGLMAAVGAVFVRESFNTRVHTTRDLAAAVAGLPILGAIPHIPSELRVQANGRQGGGGRRLFPIPAKDLFPAALVTQRRPQGIAAEAYRRVRINLTHLHADQPPRVVLITSAEPQEGKSTCTANLGVAFARQGFRVLLVDADLRRGDLHAVFGLDQQPGLTEVLAARTELAAAVQAVEVKGSAVPLHLLPTGALPDAPAELLGSSATRQVLVQMREQYDVVLIDSPPLNSATDATLLGALADTTLLVTRVGVTEREALQFAVEQLSHLPVEIGGIVVNDVREEGARYYREHRTVEA